MERDTDKFYLDIRFSKESLYKMTRALVLLQGRFLDSYYHADAQFKEHTNPVQFLVELPTGKKAEFETMTGFQLEMPPQIQGSSDL
jgi:hypothetical protein